MKLNHLKKLTAGALVMAIVAAVYGQDAAPVAATNSPTAKTVPPTSFLRLDGTDLHIGDLPPITFHGFASQGFLASSGYDYLGPTKKGSFEFTEAALNATTSPFAHTLVSVQGFIFDVGNVGQYRPLLDYAQIDYNFCTAFGVRAGRIIRPEGIYNSIQSVDLARTSILLPQGMYLATYRDFSSAIDGGSVYGDVSIPKLGDISYEGYGGLINLANDGGVARFFENKLANFPYQYQDVNGFPGAGVQLWWNTPVQGLRAGASFAYCFGFSYDFRVNVPPAFGGGEYQGIINIPIQHYSLEYQWEKWTFQTEFRSETLNQRTVANGVGQAPTHDPQDSWYVGAAYQANKWLQVGAYYTEYYGNEDNRNGTGTAVPSDAYQKDAALSFRFDPKPWWIIKVEGHAINGTALLNDNYDNPTRNGREWYMLALKTTVSF